jgi:heme exporter protein A
MQQRLSISRALINNPSILLLDEPYGGLDPSAAKMLTSQLKELRQQGRTIVMVTHDLERGLEVATRAGMLLAGKLVFLERTDQITPIEFASCYYHQLEAC